MQANPHANEVAGAFTGDGQGRVHETDPRTGREPAGSGLLARGAAVRQAQETALRNAIADLAAADSAAAWARADAEQLEAFIERELVPGIFGLIERREVIDESRDDEIYYITLSVNFNKAALRQALGKFKG